MIKLFIKYGIVIFLFNTILLSIKSTFALGNILFLFLMVIFVIVLVINTRLIKEVIFHKSFSFLLILNLINVLYFILFHAFDDIEALKYLFARGIQFSIISLSIYHNFEYLKTKFLDHIVSVVFFISILGVLVNPSIFAGRYSGIIWNPNMLASFAVIAFSILFLKKESYSNYDIFLMLFFFLISIATGSRGALVGIALAFLVRYGFAKRNLIYAVLTIGGILVISSINLDTSINRFAEQSLFNDRLLQYEYAWQTIKSKLFSGNGLDKYAYIDKSLVPIYLKGLMISSHNGYLAILTQYGLVFGGAVLLVIINKSIQVVSFFKDTSENERIYLFIVIYALFASIYETLITGINEFHTILFWFSLAFLSYSKYKMQYES